MPIAGVCRQWGWAGAFVVLAGAAQASPLTIVEVSFPAVNCVFNASCAIAVTDSVGQIAMPYLNAPDTAWLQSRSFAGASGTPAAGLTGYMYRISLAEASGSGDCLLGFVINFGPITQLPYKAGSPPADVFVGSLGGGLGAIGLASADQDNGVVTFTLKQPLCLRTEPDDDPTTFFIGLASGRPPTPVDASVFAFGTPPVYSVPARAPGIPAPTGLRIQP